MNCKGKPSLVILSDPGPVRYHLHVLDGATEGVRDGTIMNGLFAESKVCQFDVA